MTPGAWTYLPFLFGTVVLFWVLPKGRPRELLLLLSGYLFVFLLSPYFLLPLLYVTGISFVGAIIIERFTDSRNHTRVLFAFIFLVSAPLIFYKFRAPFLAALHISTPEFSAATTVWIFPVGISFYTLLAISYLVDVYLGKASPISDPTRLALFFNFFPKVIAGPLERAAGLMPQLACKLEFDADNAMSGIKCIIVGLVMKVGFADSVAATVKDLFAHPGDASALELYIGAIYYAYYAYADFAGYSLIALGSALLFNIELSQNFRQPLLSTNVLDFWRTWHITFFLWLRDYAFTPLHLTFRRLGKIGLAIALLLTLVFSGFWHGATMNYVCYALMQAIFIIFAVATTPMRTKAWKKLAAPFWLRLSSAYLITQSLILIGFVTFATPTIADALTAYSKIFSSELLNDIINIRSFKSYNHGARLFFTYYPWIAMLFLGDVWARYDLGAKMGARCRNVSEIAFYNGCIVVILYNYWSHSAATPFLYAGF